MLRAKFWPRSMRVQKLKFEGQFGIQKSTLFMILKNRDKILPANDAGVPKSRLHARERKILFLEKARVEWLQIRWSCNTPIDGNVLREKARIFF